MTSKREKLRRIAITRRTLREGGFDFDSIAKTILDPEIRSLLEARFPSEPQSRGPAPKRELELARVMDAVVALPKDERPPNARLAAKHGVTVRQLQMAYKKHAKQLRRERVIARLEELSRMTPAERAKLRSALEQKLRRAVAKPRTAAVRDAQELQSAFGLLRTMLTPNQLAK
jgi:hypothetical protein